MKLSFLLLLSLVPCASAQFPGDRAIEYPTIPGTLARDYEAPATVYEKRRSPFGGRDRIIVYETIPGTLARDYARPARVIEERRGW